METSLAWHLTKMKGKLHHSFSILLTCITVIIEKKLSNDVITICQSQKKKMFPQMLYS